MALSHINQFFGLHGIISSENTLQANTLNDFSWGGTLDIFR